MKIFQILFIFFLSTLTLSAQSYNIYSATENVTLKRGGKEINVRKGMAVKADENLFIPKDGEVRIYNPLDSKIYKSVKTGNIAVKELISEAQKASGKNNANVVDAFSVGKGYKSSVKYKHDKQGKVSRGIEKEKPELSKDCVPDSVCPCSEPSEVLEKSE